VGLSLSAYLYDIEFRLTEEHSNVDTLSRLLLSVNHDHVSVTDLDDTFMVGQI